MPMLLGSEKKKVFVGLSGGVDSAVSAALLQKEGYDVTGVFIRIAIEGYPCTAGEDKIDAMRVAAHLKIPFLAIDLSEEYKKKVFDISIKEFEKGRTPNPDALCNREIKFGLFFDWCTEQGADMVATGHYAQIKGDTFYHKRCHLLSGVDTEKDQSYFLWAVPEVKLHQTLFPVGNLKKSEVRKLAVDFGLPNAARKDSQGLCFLGPISMDDMLRQELALVPGDVIDMQGLVVGRHEGAAAYTLGQRHGFELNAHTPDTRPHFVVAKDVTANTITVSIERYPRNAAQTMVELSEENWIGPCSAEATQGEEVFARYRYRQKLIPVKWYPSEHKVILLEPHFVPEGQSLVLYNGPRCLGGGVILTAKYGDIYRESGWHARAV